LEEAAQLAIFDPKVSAEQIGADLGVEPHDGEAMQDEGVWQPAADPLTAVCGAVAGGFRAAVAVLLLTEWQQFRQLDWPALAADARLPARRGCGCGLRGRVRGTAPVWRRPPGGGLIRGADVHRRRPTGKPGKAEMIRAVVQAYYDGIGVGAGSLR
jgi:hypothetical protein